MIYATNASTIDLCLSMFSWANFLKKKAATKLCTCIDLIGSITVPIQITGGLVYDVYFMDQMRIEAGSVYVLEPG